MVLDHYRDTHCMVGKVGKRAGMVKNEFKVVWDGPEVTSPRLSGVQAPVHLSRSPGMKSSGQYCVAEVDANNALEILL